MKKPSVIMRHMIMSNSHLFSCKMTEVQQYYNIPTRVIHLYTRVIDTNA